MTKHFIDRYVSLPKQSFFLFGPRGTGKSTLLQMRYPEALRLDFLNPAIERTYNSRPERLYDLLKTADKHQPIIIDEVQKVPSILTIVHEQIVSDSQWQFILTGSNARKLK